MNITVELRGGDDVRRVVGEYTKEAAQKVIQALKRGALRIERQAKFNITANGYSPATKVPTGRLRSSISVNWAGSGKSHGDVESKAKPADGVSEPVGASNLAFAVGTNVIYGRRVEVGFMDKDSLGRQYHQEAKPYLYPAYFSLEGEIIDDLKKALKK